MKEVDNVRWLIRILRLIFHNYQVLEIFRELENRRVRFIKFSHINLNPFLLRIFALVIFCELVKDHLQIFADFLLIVKEVWIVGIIFFPSHDLGIVIELHVAVKRVCLKNNHVLLIKIKVDGLVDVN